MNHEMKSSDQRTFCHEVISSDQRTFTAAPVGTFRHSVSHGL